LRVYDVSLPVKTTTDYVAAFKFRLSDPYGGAGIGGNTSKLLDRIGELEKKVKDGDGEGGEDIMDHIIGWFKDPEKLESVVGTIKQLLGSQTPQALPAAENIQAMAGFKVTSDNANDNDAKLNRLAAVLDDLEKRDPKLLDHLEKLSKLDAMTFGMVTSRLDSL
jgi:hypothetical protein